MPSLYEKLSAVDVGPGNHDNFFEIRQHGENVVTVGVVFLVNVNDE